MTQMVRRWLLRCAVLVVLVTAVLASSPNHSHMRRLQQRRPVMPGDNEAGAAAVAVPSSMMQHAALRSSKPPAPRGLQGGISASEGEVAAPAAAGMPGSVPVAAAAPTREESNSKRNDGRTTTRTAAPNKQHAPTRKQPEGRHGSRKDMGKKSPSVEESESSTPPENLEAFPPPTPVSSPPTPPARVPARSSAVPSNTFDAAGTLPSEVETHSRVPNSATPSSPGQGKQDEPIVPPSTNPTAMRFAEGQRRAEKLRKEREAKARKQQPQPDAGISSPDPFAAVSDDTNSRPGLAARELDINGLQTEIVAGGASIQDPAVTSDASSSSTVDNSAGSLSPAGGGANTPASRPVTKPARNSRGPIPPPKVPARWITNESQAQPSSQKLSSQQGASAQSSKTSLPKNTRRQGTNDHTARRSSSSLPAAGRSSSPAASSSSPSLSYAGVVATTEEPSSGPPPDATDASVTPLEDDTAPAAVLTTPPPAVGDSVDANAAAPSSSPSPSATPKRISRPEPPVVRGQSTVAQPPEPQSGANDLPLGPPEPRRRATQPVGKAPLKPAAGSTKKGPKVEFTSSILAPSTATVTKQPAPTTETPTKKMVDEEETPAAAAGAGADELENASQPPPSVVEVAGVAPISRPELEPVFVQPDPLPLTPTTPDVVPTPPSLAAAAPGAGADEEPDKPTPDAEPRSNNAAEPTPIVAPPAPAVPAVEEDVVDPERYPAETTTPPPAAAVAPVVPAVVPTPSTPLTPLTPVDADAERQAHLARMMPPPPPRPTVIVEEPKKKKDPLTTVEEVDLTPSLPTTPTPTPTTPEIIEPIVEDHTSPSSIFKKNRTKPKPSPSSSSSDNDIIDPIVSPSPPSTNEVDVAATNPDATPATTTLEWRPVSPTAGTGGRSGSGLVLMFAFMSFCCFVMMRLKKMLSSDEGGNGHHHGEDHGMSSGSGNGAGGDIEESNSLLASASASSPQRGRAHSAHIKPGSGMVVLDALTDEEDPEAGFSSRHNGGGETAATTATPAATEAPPAARGMSLKAAGGRPARPSGPKKGKVGLGAKPLEESD